MTHYVIHRADGSMQSQGSSAPVRTAQELTGMGLTVKTFPSRPPGMLWNDATLGFDIPEPLRKLDPGEFFENIPAPLLQKIIAHADTRVDNTAAWLMLLQMGRAVDQQQQWFINGLQTLVAAGVLTAKQAKRIGEWT